MRKEIMNKMVVDLLQQKGLGLQGVTRMAYSPSLWLLQQKGLGC
jgi:hypothetical protein